MDKVDMDIATLLLEMAKAIMALAPNECPDLETAAKKLADAMLPSPEMDETGRVYLPSEDKPPMTIVMGEPVEEDNPDGDN